MSSKATVIFRCADFKRPLEQSRRCGLHRRRSRLERRGGMIEFRVPGYCQPWQRSGQSGKRHFPNQKTASYKGVVILFARQAMARASIHAPLSGPLSLSVVVYRKMVKASALKTHSMQAGNIRPATKPDLDNCVKAILDALNGVAFVDDGQVVEIHAAKYYDDGGGERTVVKIEAAI